MESKAYMRGYCGLSMLEGFVNADYEDYDRGVRDSGKDTLKLDVETGGDRELDMILEGF